MKNYKFVVALIISMLIVPYVVFVYVVSVSVSPFSSFVHTVEATVLIILLVVGLWRKPKSKLGIMFVGLGVIQLFLAGNAFKGTMFYYNPMTPVPGIGGFVAMILVVLATFAIYYYIGWGLSKLYGKFIGKKRAAKKLK